MYVWNDHQKEFMHINIIFKMDKWMNVWNDHQKEFMGIQGLNLERRRGTSLCNAPYTITKKWAIFQKSNSHKGDENTQWQLMESFYVICFLMAIEGRPK